MKPRRLSAIGTKLVFFSGESVYKSNRGRSALTRGTFTLESCGEFECTLERVKTVLPDYGRAVTWRQRSESRHYVIARRLRITKPECLAALREESRGLERLQVVTSGNLYTASMRGHRDNSCLKTSDGSVRDRLRNHAHGVAGLRALTWYGAHSWHGSGVNRPGNSSKRRLVCIAAGFRPMNWLKIFAEAQVVSRNSRGARRGFSGLPLPETHPVCEPGNLASTRD